MNLLRRGGNSNKTDCRRRRKSLDGTDKNLIILQQDALFYLLSHGFAKFRMINFVYQKSDIRICGRCECLDPPLVQTCNSGALDYRYFVRDASGILLMRLAALEKQRSTVMVTIPLFISPFFH